MLDDILTVLMGLLIFGSFAGFVLLVSYLCAKSSVKKPGDPFRVGDKVKVVDRDGTFGFAVVEAVHRRGGNDSLVLSGFTEEFRALEGTNNGRVHHVTLSEETDNFE